MLNKFIVKVLPLFPKKFIWLFSKKYISGTTLDSAVKVSKALNAKKMMVTIDELGEFITELHEADKNTKAYYQIIERMQAEKINGNYSLKPTMFGLLLDKNHCYKNIREVVKKAADFGNFVRIDMEDSQCVDLEIELYEKLHKEFPKNVGIVFQSYMRRTLNDLKYLSKRHSAETPVNVRLCKGIYNEPESIAFKDHDEINTHFLKDLEFLFQQKMYTGIATHDKSLVNGAYELIEKYGTTQKDYEFQMLYGVTHRLRQSIIDKGHPMRIYVPFGQQWFGYSTRRLKENPKMATHIIKALFLKK